VTLDQVEGQKISVAVGLLAVVEDQAFGVVAEKPDLDVEGLAHVAQRREFNETGML
jgi:hypothetical protein